MRVLLRPPTESDREQFVAAMLLSEPLHKPWINDVATDTYFDRLLARADDERHDTMLACLVDGGAIVGLINLSEIVRGAFQNAFLSYAVVTGYGRQGLMREGLRLMLERAFEALGLHRLEANIQPPNAASIALVKRAGFVYEGTSRRYLQVDGDWRDHEHWVMLADEWRAGRDRA
ncbi:MAG TPA: GNAT family protein [Solirubrobacteraceae bacterium]|nr:GNAT family protein [Solirubrobacteraceae bacterium]